MAVGIEPIKPKFVDREQELKQLLTLLKNMLAGEGRIVFITGEAGIGKTRLMTEFLALAEEKGATVLTGRCLYREYSHPYLPFIEALERYSKKSGSFFDETLPVSMISAGAGSDEVLPMGLIGISEAPEEFRSSEMMQDKRDRMLDTLSEQIINISRKQPLVIFLDDVQWIDAASAQLLEYLGRAVRSSRMLICSTYRSEELEGSAHPLQSTLKKLTEENVCTMIALQRLTLNNVETMIKSMMKAENISKSFIFHLYEESEGNPFFIEEVIKSLISEGIIDPNAYIWEHINLDKVRIPSTIKDVISRRIIGLDENSKRVLMYASIVGNRFSFDVVHKASGLSDNDMLDSVDKLVGLKLIREDRSGEQEAYVFESAQVRAVIYDSLSRSRLRLMHKRIGELLEEAHRKNLDEVVYALARHFTIGKEAEKAYTYALRAGDKSAQLFGTEDAIEYYKAALSALDELPTTPENKRKRIGVLMKLGMNYQIIGESQQAIEYYQNVVKLCEELGDNARASEAHRGIANQMLETGQYDDAVKVYRTALKISEAIHDLRGIADSHYGLGYVLWRRGIHEEALAQLHKSLVTAQRIGDIKTIGRTMIAIGNVYNYKGEFSRAIEYYLRSADELRKVSNYEEIARAYNNLGDIYMKMKDWPKAISYFEKCVEYAEKIGSRKYLGWAYFNSTECYAKKGDLAKAKELAEKAHRILERIRDEVGLRSIYKNYGLIYRAEKNWAEAEKWFNKSLQLTEKLDIPYEFAETSYEFGLMYKDKGEPQEALRHFKNAIMIFTKIGATEEVAAVRKALDELKPA